MYLKRYLYVTGFKLLIYNTLTSPNQTIILLYNFRKEIV